jgi:hypothetical protein
MPGGPVLEAGGLGVGSAQLLLEPDPETQEANRSVAGSRSQEACNRFLYDASISSGMLRIRSPSDIARSATHRLYVAVPREDHWHTFGLWPVDFTDVTQVVSGPTQLPFCCIAHS